MSEISELFNRVKELEAEINGIKQDIHVLKDYIKVNTAAITIMSKGLGGDVNDLFNDAYNSVGMSNMINRGKPK